MYKYYGLKQNDCDTQSPHYNTPQVLDLDVLGRPFQTIDDNGTFGLVTTHNQLDISGRILVVTDALGRTATQNKFALSEKHQVYVENIDSGKRWMINDTAGNRRYLWDNRSHRLKTLYDALLRPTQTLLKTGSSTEIITQIIVYGTSVAQNNIGQVIEVKAQDGQTSFEYDFKGNVTKQTKQFAQDYQNELDWNGTVTLINETFIQETTYDALNRPVTVTQPDNTVVANIYDKGGLLKQVLHNSTQHITNITYNPREQRENIYYGNNTKTRYYYNPLNFRLTRILTTRNNGQDVLQDLNYTYDAVGNITGITDNAQQTFYFNNQVIAPTGSYTYDALYRLLTATGREQTALAMPTDTDFVNNIPCPDTASNAMQNYTQHYQYDALGNMLQMQSVGNWTRNYEYNNPMNNNYLLGHGGGTVYTYDAHGNMLTMPHLSNMSYDYQDQLHSASNGTFTSYYNYDAEGNRSRKVVVKGNIREDRYYVNGYEIYRKYTNDTLDFERKTVNIADDEKVFVRIEQKTGENPVIRYQYDNHLGSACLELDELGAIISYEEYHPFGTTSYRSGRTETEVSLKRYKYCGKERDEETGLYYYGMRYYAAWLCRFVSVDPLQFKYPHYTPYQYAGNKPVTFIDLDGGEEKEPEEEQTGFYSGKGTQENPIQLSEINVNTNKTKERIKFEEYPDVQESTGWSLLNPKHKEKYQIGEAEGLVGMLFFSQINFDVVYLKGDILNKIQKDPAMISFENSIIGKAKSDERYGKEDYSLSGFKQILFGGQRWTSKDESWFSLSNKNPLFHNSTWEVAKNELTWTLRHATVKYFATVSKEGKINIEYKLNDVFDLTPHGKEETDYNKITKKLGYIYHDILGGNRNLQIRAEWKIEK